MTEHYSQRNLRNRLSELFTHIGMTTAPGSEAKKYVCLIVCVGLTSLSTTLQAKTKLENVSLKPSSSEFASPPRINVKWNADHSQREVSDDYIYIPVEVSGKVDNLSQRFEIFKAWVFVTGGSKPITQQIPPYGYSLLRNRQSTRNIGGEQTLVFRKQHLRQLEGQAINICEAKARPNETSYHPINIPLSLSVTAGKLVVNASRKQVVNRSDGTVIKGDVACHRKKPGVRTSTSTRGSNAAPRAKKASELTRSTTPDSVVRSNPDPVRTNATDSPAAQQEAASNPDMIIRAVRAERARSLSVYVHSKGGASGRCVLIARFQRHGKPVLTENQVGPFDHNQTIESVFRFKQMTADMPARVTFSLHCPVDRNPDNNEYRYTKAATQ